MKLTQGTELMASTVIVEPTEAQAIVSHKCSLDPVAVGWGVGRVDRDRAPRRARTGSW